MHTRSKTTTQSRHSISASKHSLQSQHRRWRQRHTVHCHMSQEPILLCVVLPLVRLVVHYVLFLWPSWLWPLEARLLLAGMLFGVLPSSPARSSRGKRSVELAGWKYRQQQTSHSQRFLIYSFLLWCYLREAVGIASRFLSRSPITSFSDVENDM